MFATSLRCWRTISRRRATPSSTYAETNTTSGRAAASRRTTAAGSNPCSAYGNCPADGSPRR